MTTNKPSGESMNVVYAGLKTASIDQLRMLWKTTQPLALSGCEESKLLLRQIIYVLQRYHFNIFYPESDDETNIQESTD